jgi:hypothetical protein
MPSTVDTTDTGDQVSLGVLGVSLADSVEIGSTSVDLIGGSDRRQGGETT